MRETIVREYVQWKRFINYYGIDTRDLSIFDIVVNVGKMGIEEVFEVLKSFIEKNLKHE